MDVKRMLEIMRVENSAESAEVDSSADILSKSDFHSTLEQLVGKYYKNETPLALLFMDVNYFKSVNDSLGHAEGDKIIADIRQMLKQQFRSAPERGENCDYIAIRGTDSSALSKPISSHNHLGTELMLGHIGGDEFAILCKTDDSGAQVIAERVRGSFHDYVNQPGNETLKNLGVSFAIGHSVMKPGMSSSDLLAMADKAMYEDKLRQLRKLEPSHEQELVEMFDRLESLNIRLRDLGKYAIMLGRQRSG